MISGPLETRDGTDWLKRRAVPRTKHSDGTSHDQALMRVTHKQFGSCAAPAARPQFSSRRKKKKKFGCYELLAPRPKKLITVMPCILLKNIKRQITPSWQASCPDDRQPCAMAFLNFARGLPSYDPPSCFKNKKHHHCRVVSTAKANYSCRLGRNDFCTMT